MGAIGTTQVLSMGTMDEAHYMMPIPPHMPMTHSFKGNQVKEASQSYIINTI